MARSLFGRTFPAAPPAPDPPLSAEVLAQLRADVSELLEADSSTTIDEGHAILRRVREAGGPQALNLGFGDTMALTFKSMQYARRALDDVQRRARAQERLRVRASSRGQIHLHFIKTELAWKSDRSRYVLSLLSRPPKQLLWCVCNWELTVPSGARARAPKNNPLG